MPDSLFTWVNVQNQGAVATGAGSNTGTFGFAINDIVHPFSKSGGVGVTLPLPIIAIATQNPAGVTNLMSGFVAGAGLYQNFRVWAIDVTLTVTPGNAADSQSCAIAPLSVAGVAYANNETASAGPNAVSKSSTFGSSGAGNTLRALWKMPALHGVPARLYKAFASNIGNAVTAPGLPLFAQFTFRDDANQNLTANLGIRVNLQYHVEFFNRTDTGLI